MIGRIKIYDYVGQNEGGGREEYEAFAEFSERDDVTTIEIHGYRRSEQVEEVEPPLSSPAHGVWGAMHPK